MTYTQETSIDVGNFVITPSTRLTDTGTYQAAVSIQSGNGLAKHDRVFRFHPVFPSREGARMYAITQGHCWLQQQHRA